MHNIQPSKDTKASLTFIVFIFVLLGLGIYLMASSLFNKESSPVIFILPKSSQISILKTNTKVLCKTQGTSQTCHTKLKWGSHQVGVKIGSKEFTQEINIHKSKGTLIYHWEQEILNLVSTKE